MMRLRLPLHRRRRSLLLDAVFFVWLSYVVVSGHILPDALIHLLQPQPSATVVSEPVPAPADAPALIVEEAPEAASRHLAVTMAI